MLSPGPPPPPSMLCPTTNSIAVMTSYHLPLSSSSFGNWDEGSEGGGSATNLFTVRYHPSPPRPLSPCFDPPPLSKLHHICNAPLWPDAVLFWSRQPPPLITCPEMMILFSLKPHTPTPSLSHSSLSLSFSLNHLSPSSLSCVIFLYTSLLKVLHHLAP